MAMAKMVKELHANPDSGFLGGNPSVMVQYWKSFEALEAYATRRSTTTCRGSGLGRVGELAPATGACESAAGRFKRHV